MATLNMTRFVVRGTAVVLATGLAAWVAVTAWNGAADSERPGYEQSTTASSESASTQDGSLSVVASLNGYTIRASNASRFLVLQKLATEAKFNLVDNVGIHPNISLQVNDVSLEEALAHVLEGTQYSVLYEVVLLGRDTIITQVELEPGMGEPLLANINVSAGADAAQLTGEEFKEEKQQKEKRKVRVKEGEDGEPDVYEEVEFNVLTPQDIATAIADREALIQEEKLRNLKFLESGDAEERGRAVFMLDPEQAEDLYRITDRLTYDSEPAVRAEAAFRLSFGDPQVAVPTLVAALKDPSSDVVAAAVKGIGYAGSAANIADIKPLLDSDSAKVAAAATDAILILEQTQR